MNFQPYKNLYLSPGRAIHVATYLLCVAAGLLYMSHFSFDDKVNLSGDEWEYQSIAVNFVHGHGFPVSGGYEDTAAYRLVTYPGLHGARTWQDFYTSGRGYDLYRNPAYPFFVAAVYRAVGVRPEMLRMLQFILLILAGSLLPYLCSRIFGSGGLLIGICSYAVFLLPDHSYAQDVMCEALIVVYLICFLLAYTVLHHAQRAIHALALGMIMGIGLLLKNYFVPLFLIMTASAVYGAFISKRTPAKNVIAIIAGIMIVILPWTVYANHLLDKSSRAHAPILITTQGDDVLLGSNNEYSADGLWHPEWADHPESFYQQPGIAAHSAWRQAASFYLHHLSWIPFFFSSKIMMGLFATLSQLAFYLSALGFVMVRYVRKKELLLIPILIAAAVTATTGGHIQGLLLILSDSLLNVHHLMRYILIAATAFTLWLYVGILFRESSFRYYICFLLLANFALLTLIYYGNSRITGVVDFVCLIFTFYNVSQSVSMLIKKHLPGQ